MIRSKVFDLISWSEVESGYTPSDNDLDFPVHVPSAVSRFQARAALVDAGLLADAEIAVSSMGPLEQLAWSEATEWRRDSPTIAAMADLLGLTSDQVDELFVSASKIIA